MSTEDAFVFNCAGDDLVGILHSPDTTPTQGILMIVGGPQYRVGSHRQFLEYARAMAANGIAVMRFDYRGMGDSAGDFLEFEDVELDVRTAMDEFARRVPSIDEFFWFGLCDAASVALMYGTSDQRIEGFILMNPWVRSEQSHATAQIKNYYGQRFFNRAFWKKLLTGQVKVFSSVKELAAKFLVSRQKQSIEPTDFRHKMLLGAKKYQGRVLLFMSGDDLTASEFDETIDASKQWQKVVQSSKWTRHSISKANHTFSSAKWKQELIDKSLSWLQAN